jgi:hypothetical protein
LASFKLENKKAERRKTLGKREPTESNKNWSWKLRSGFRKEEATKSIKLA